MHPIKTTGLAGLDTILCGGFRPSTIALIEGLPGTGKTLLASQFAANASAEMPTLYLSFEIDRQSVEDVFASFSWPVTDRFDFVEMSPVHFIDDGGRQLEERLRKSGAKRLVIDSLTPIRLHFEGKPEREYRQFLQGVFQKLRALTVVTMIITETSPSRQLGETGAGPEHFLADTVITLRKEEQRRGLLRSLEVAKSRGQKVLMGRHSFRIDDERGLCVYPRAYARGRVNVAVPVTTEKVPFGISGLEEMLGGGVFKASSTLMVGISGTGKTVASMHFLNEGLKRGESCMIVTLDDSPAQFCRDAAQLGFHFSQFLEDGLLTILHETPLEIELDAHFCEIEEIVKEKNCARVVIDSVATYEMVLPNEVHEFFIALGGLLRATGATSVFNYECPELLGISQISEKLKASALADNIVLFNYVEISTTLRRAMTVPKTRGSKPDQQTREYVIKSGGIAVLDEASVPQEQRVPQLPLSCYYGVLARSPTRHAPLIDESVAAGKPMPKSRIPKPVKKSATVN